MKIGIDISQAQYQGTGVGTYTYQLVKHLLSLDSGHEFVLFGGSLRDFSNLKTIAQSFEPKASSKLFRLPPTAADYIFNKGKLPIEIFTGSVDVFHSSDWTQPSSRKAKLVTTIHDLTTIKYPEHQHSKIIQTHKRRLDKIVEQQIPIIADSQATKDDIIKAFGLPATLIRVIHLAAGEDFLNFSHLARPERTKLVTKTKSKLKLDKPYVLSVGTREPRKNTDRVIKAFVEFKKKNPTSKLELVIAGRYGWGADLESVVAEYQSSIKLLGFVDQIDLPALYRGAQAFIYPSLYEGFGLPVLEAMTVGCPVITSQKGSLKEVAGEAAILVNPHSVASITQGIALGLADRKELIAKGQKQAQKFSWRKTAEETLAVYESL